MRRQPGHIPSAKPLACAPKNWSKRLQLRWTSVRARTAFEEALLVEASDGRLCAGGSAEVFDYNSYPILTEPLPISSGTHREKS